MKYFLYYTDTGNAIVFHSEKDLQDFLKEWINDLVEEVDFEIYKGSLEKIGKVVFPKPHIEWE